MANTTARTTSGPVEGRERDGVVLFAGIPYAAPTGGEHRFRPPRPVEPWTGTRPCLRFGDACPQISGDGLTSAPPKSVSEDCLSLNVSTPAVDDAGRPVLVWIHGGGFRNGQGAIPWYDGAAFGRNGDVVVVSINYRLGALGFLDVSSFGGEYADSGVAGLADQIAALEWVRDNIAAFGGDPGQVTIAGESAGAFSVTSLLASPRTAGLFRRAIAQSGAGHHVVTPEQADAVAGTFLGHLGVTSMEELQTVEVARLLDAQAATEKELGDGTSGPRPHGLTTMPFYPRIATSVLPETPVALLAAGHGADVPLLTGTNADETTLFELFTSVPDVAKVRERAGRLVGPDAARELVDTYLAAEPDLDGRVLQTRVNTDWMFRIPAVRAAEARADAPAATWMYLFDWASTAFDGMIGATHALEIPFAFDNLHQAGVELFTGPEPPQAVADDMHAAWIEFARTGDPGWAAYTPRSRQVRVFGAEPGMVTDPMSAQREAWADLR